MSDTKKKYSVLVVSDSDKLSKELILGSASDLDIKKTVKGGEEAYEELKKNSYDLIIAPPSLISGFRSEEAEAQSDSEIEEYHTGKIAELFLSRSAELKEYIGSMKNDITAKVLDAARADRILYDIYTFSIERVFGESEWLELYLSQEDFLAHGTEQQKDRLTALYRDYTALFPPVNNEKTEEIILYILNNPESDLRQKTIAGKMYLNSSYLSTVFATQTGVRFVDYLMTVKLKRAGYLLTKTTMRVSEIAARLDYKDIGYFSRLFKNHYGIPPSQYRVPDNYTYVI